MKVGAPLAAAKGVGADGRVLVKVGGQLAAAKGAGADGRVLLEVVGVVNALGALVGGPVQELPTALTCVSSMAAR